MYTLLVTNVDGSHVSGSWTEKPTREQLQYELGGIWDDDTEFNIIHDLQAYHHAEVEDSACTTYELSEV